MGFSHDSSGRLTFDVPGVTDLEFASVCKEIADALNLEPDHELIVGPGQMFWAFRREANIVGIDWDVWMGFMVVAFTPASEQLVREIAAWLYSSRWSEFIKS